MSVATGKKPMNERLQHLFNIISSRRFLEKKALNGEIPFYVSAHSPEDAVEMERLQRQLSNRLEQAGVKVLDINLYDLSIRYSKCGESGSNSSIWSNLCLRKS